MQIKDTEFRFAALGLRRAALMAGASLMVCAMPAFAQDSAGEQAQAAGDAPADQASTDDGAGDKAIEIVVTGTSIRGVAPVGSNLISITADELQQGGSVTTADALREIPQIFNYGVTEGSRSGTGGAGNIVYGNAINLRGISPYATLTLINGRRAVPQGTVGATVDPSTIPALALERIEVIADGASAIYGSDAVTGVANLIMKRGYDGAKLTARYGIADEYHNAQIGGIFGTSWDSGQVTVSVQHAYKSNLNGQDRDFYSADLTDRGGSNYLESQCTPGNIVVGGQTYAIPEGGATPGNLAAGTLNQCDNIKNVDILPQQEMNTAALTFDQEIAAGVNFFVDAYANRRDGLRRSAKDTANLAVPETNPYFVAPEGVTLDPCPSSLGVPDGTGCETVQYSFLTEGGTYEESDIVSKTYQVSAGFDIELGGDFHINTYGTIGYNHDHVSTFGGNLNNSALSAALASTDPDTALNVFGTSPNSQAVVDAIYNNLTETDGKTKFRAAEIQLDGPLFQLPAGAVKFAVGAEYFKLKLRTGQLRGPAGNLSGTDVRLGRDVKSAYAELNVPIFGPDNAVPFIQEFDLNFAGRIDDYSDVGSTTNPKVGFNWRPVDDLLIHGSYGESFRAPELTRLQSAGGSYIYLQSYYDPTANNGAGGTIIGAALSGGNLDLAPETSRSYSLGADYTPSFMPGARFSLNYFDLVYEGQINGFLSNRNVLRSEDQFSSIILRGDAAQARIAELIAGGRGVRGGTVDNALQSTVFVDGRPNNLGTTITRGLDIMASVPFDIGADRLRVGLSGIHFFTYKSALTPTTEPSNELNNIEYPLRWRLRGTVDYSTGGLNAGVAVNFANAYTNTFADPDESVDAFTTVDLRLSYDLGETGIYGTEGVRLGLDVQNLFDADPPFVDLAPIGNGGGGGYDASNASPIGRLVSFSLTKEF